MASNWNWSPEMNEDDWEKLDSLEGIWKELLLGKSKSSVLAWISSLTSGFQNTSYEIFWFTILCSLKIPNFCYVSELKVLADSKIGNYYAATGS